MCFSFLTLGLWSNKTSCFYSSRYILYPYFLIIFSTFPPSPTVCLRLNQRQKIAFIQVFHFSRQLHGMKRQNFSKQENMMLNRNVIEICLYYDCFLQFLHDIWIILIDWSLYTHSEHRNISTLFLTIGQNGLVRFCGEHSKNNILAT